jgi:hypothetical protein
MESACGQMLKLGISLFGALEASGVCPLRGETVEKLDCARNS